MNASNVFNNYNKLLLKENYYNYLYNPSNRQNQKKIILSLADAIKKNDIHYEINNLKKNDSLTTIDAMYNPYMLKLTQEEQPTYENIKLNNKNYILNEIKQRQRTAKIRPKSKAIDIQRYSDCVNFSEKKKLNSAFSYSKYNKSKKNLITDSEKRIFQFKKNCPCCNNIFQVDKTKSNNKFDKILLDKQLNIYNNKHFKDSLSCFIYHINHFTSKELENKKETLLNANSKKNINYNTDMTSEFTKDLKKIKFREIQRVEFDPSNLYIIQKPLIPTIRGKILRNLRKRYHKPIRNVVISKNRPSSSNYIDNMKKYIFKN